MAGFGRVPPFSTDGEGSGGGGGGRAAQSPPGAGDRLRYVCTDYRWRFWLGNTGDTSTLHHHPRRHKFTTAPGDTKGLFTTAPGDTKGHTEVDPHECRINVNIPDDNHNQNKQSLISNQCVFYHTVECLTV